MRNGIKINYMYFPLMLASSRRSRYHLGKNGSVFTAIPWKVFRACFLLYFFLWEESFCFTFHCIQYISQQEGRTSSIMLYVDSEIIGDQ